MEPSVTAFATCADVESAPLLSGTTARLTGVAIALAFAVFASPPPAVAQEEPRPTLARHLECESGGGQHVFENQTLRLIVHTSVGGNGLRVRLSNTFGTGSLVIGAVHVAIRTTDAAIVPVSDRALTFGGALSISIPPGALLVSDPVDLDVPPVQDLAVSIYLPGNTGPATRHPSALQTSYISPTGDFSGAITMPFTETTQSSFFLTDVGGTACGHAGAILTFGDSITDGTGSTPDTNNRWPNHLANRLLTANGDRRLAVLNEGIAFNRILHDGPFVNGPAGVSASARFDHDVLTQTGVTRMIMLARSSTSNRRAKFRGFFVKFRGWHNSGTARRTHHVGSRVSRPALSQRLHRQTSDRNGAVDVHALQSGMRFHLRWCSDGYRRDSVKR